VLKIVHPTVFALIPTFNEPDLVAQCVESLVREGVRGIVINAGDALGPLPEGFIEIRVSADHFWTACMNRGIDHAKAHGAERVLLMNADTRLRPGSLSALTDVLDRIPNSIATSPAYVATPQGERLLYSRQDDWGFLLYGRIRRDWNTPHDAPKDSFVTDVIGGQGVLIPIQALEVVRLDEERFPQYASDHDLWYTLRERGWTLRVAPGAGIVNDREFNRGSQRSLPRELWRRLTSPMAPESAVIMWRLRRKHLPLPIAAVSFVLAFTLRWTVGLPKIIARSR
jgi:GT2 family glycosyltransferase